MTSSIPEGETAKPFQTALTGFPMLKPEAPEGRPRRRKAQAQRQAPLRTCGQCARRFRSWKEGAVCGRCEEDGAKRAAARADSPQLSELPGETWEDAFGGAA